MPKTYKEIQENLVNKPKTWLVTGAAGFIGSHLIETLLRLDQHVIGIDNFLREKHTNLTLIQENISPQQWDKFDFFDADLSNTELCREIFSLYPHIDYVLHQAALCSVPHSIANPEVCHNHNVNGFLNVLMSSQHNKVSRVVYASSSAVYGDCLDLPCIENRTGTLLSPYAITKYTDELYAGLYTRSYGLSTVGLRYFNVFGPRQDPEGPYAAVIPQWISAFMEGDSVTLFGDGSQTRDFCYIDNVVQANIVAAINPLEEESPIVYNVGTGESITILNLLTHLTDIFTEKNPTKEVDVIRLKNRACDVMHSRADTSLIQEHLGYKPDVDLVSQILLTYDWYQSHLLSDFTSTKTAVIHLGENRQLRNAVK